MQPAEPEPAAAAAAAAAACDAAGARVGVDDREEVEERLRRVLADAVAGVDHRLRRRAAAAAAVPFCGCRSTRTSQ